MQCHEVTVELEPVLEALAERELAPRIASLQKYSQGDKQQQASATVSELITRATVELGSVLSEHNDITHFLVYYSSYLDSTHGRTRWVTVPTKSQSHQFVMRPELVYLERLSTAGQPPSSTSEQR